MNKFVVACMAVFVTGCHDKSCNPFPIELETPPPVVSIIPLADQNFTRTVFIAHSLMDFTFNLDPNNPGGYLFTAHDTVTALMTQEGRRTHDIARGGQQMQAAHKLGVAGAPNYLRGGSTMAVVIILAHNDWAGGSGDNYSYYDDAIGFLDAIDRDGGNVVPFCVVPVLAGHDRTGITNRFGESYEDMRDMVRNVAATGKCELIETGDWFEDSDLDDPLMFPDQLHLGPNGQARYKEELVKVLDAYKF